MRRRLSELMSRWQREAGAGRVLLALKTALACGIAWWLAPLVPFAENDYSYYAPLGALVSMYPTIVQSLRTGVQTLSGVAIGVAIGLAGLGVVLVGVPPIVVLVAVVGIGVLAGAIPRLGAGSDWVPMAGIFMLLIGGTDAEDFSVSYLVTLAFGVIVGLVVNLVVIPPLYLRHADRRISQLRDVAAGSLREVAELVADDDAGGEDVERMLDNLRRTASAVAADVQGAEESARANPRSRRHGDERQLNRRRAQAIERSVFSIRDLCDALFGDDEERSLRVPMDARGTLADAINACADLVGAPVGDENAPELLSDAEHALDRYLSVIEDPRGDHGASMAAAFCLQRIIGNARPFV